MLFCISNRGAAAWGTSHGEHPVLESWLQRMSGTWRLHGGRRGGRAVDVRDAREAKMEVSWGRPDRREAQQTGASHDFYVSGPCDDRHHSQAESPTGGQAGGGGGADPEPGFGLWNGHPWHPTQTSFRSPLPSSRGTFLSGALFVTTALSSYPKVSFPGPHPPRTVLPGIGCKPASVSFRRLPSLPFEGWPSICPLRLENSLSRSTSCF